MKRIALPCAVALALAGCASNADQPSLQAAAVDTSKMPHAGIFTVKDVVVTDQGQDTLRLAAATTNKFTFADLSAVIWCRAREEAVARKYDGDNTFNTSEVLGRAIAQGISTTYYPSGSTTGEKLAEKYAYALGRDALTNVFREF